MNAIAKIEKSNSFGFTKSTVELIKRTVAKNATDDQFAAFLYQANKTGLDPLAKQIFLRLNWNDKDKSYNMSVQTTIDGYRVIAERTGQYAGSDDYKFDEGISQYEHIKSKRGVPTTATATVYKLVGGQRVPFVATCEWSSYFPGEKQGFMWKKMPYLMLGKTAESLALRKAFPEDLSGVYTDSEMESAANEKPMAANSNGFYMPSKREPLVAKSQLEEIAEANTKEHLETISLELDDEIPEFETKKPSVTKLPEKIPDLTFEEFIFTPSFSELIKLPELAGQQLGDLSMNQLISFAEYFSKIKDGAQDAHNKKWGEYLYQITTDALSNKYQPKPAA